jgi:hypothetical protein
MAIFDAFLAFSSAQAVTATAVSTNVLDLANERDIGIGREELTVAIYTTTALTSGGSTTLVVDLQTAPDSSGSPGTYLTIAKSPTMAIADIAAAGTKVCEIRIPATIPQTGANLGRFLRLNYTVAVSDFTAGAFTAYIVGAHDNVPTYPAGVIIAN